MVAVSELFDLKRGTCVSMADRTPGSTPLVSATTYQNGVCGFVSADASELFPGSSLVVAVIGEGSVMFASVQPVPFVATINVEVLVPKIGHEFFKVDREARLIAVAAQLRKARWRFHYGRVASGRVKSLTLDLVLAEATATKLAKRQVETNGPAKASVAAVLSTLKTLYGNRPTVADAFDVRVGASTSVANLRETGELPVISATEKETNGVAGFIERSVAKLQPAMSISVAKDGKPGVARVQPAEYHATEHVSCLVPKHPWTLSELTVLAALIERQTWRFSFGRAASYARLVSLPLW